MDNNTRYVELLHPTDELELVFIKSVLEAEGLRYVVRNERFGGLYVGPRIELYNTITVLVERDDEALASELISAYLNENAELMETPEPSGPITPPHGIWMRLLDMARLVMEVLLFGWLVPRRRRSDRNLD